MELETFRLRVATELRKADYHDLADSVMSATDSRLWQLHDASNGNPHDAAYSVASGH